MKTLNREVWKGSCKTEVFERKVAELEVEYNRLSQENVVSKNVVSSLTSLASQTAGSNLYA